MTMPIQAAVIMRIRDGFISLEVSGDGIRDNAGHPKIEAGSGQVLNFHDGKCHN